MPHFLVHGSTPCLLSSLEGPRAWLGELFYPWSNSSSWGSGLQPHPPGCLCMWRCGCHPSQARSGSGSTGNSKETQLHRCCGITAMQHSCLLTPIHVWQTPNPVMAHGSCWVTSEHSAPLAPTGRWCKSGQWERHCFLALMETATKAWNKPRISLVQP